MTIIVEINLGSDDGGGEELGGSKRSERPEAEPGEKGESQSRSMSIGEEPLAETSREVFGLKPEVYEAVSKGVLIQINRWETKGRTAGHIFRWLCS